KPTSKIGFHLQGCPAWRRFEQAVCRRRPLGPKVTKKGVGSRDISELKRRIAGGRYARALCPLAVLRQQMPLLRLQQPRPRDDRTGYVARSAAGGPRA